MSREKGPDSSPGHSRNSDECFSAQSGTVRIDAEVGGVHFVLSRSHGLPGTSRVLSVLLAVA